MFFSSELILNHITLMTETPHPETISLSDLAQNNLVAGYQLLAKLDQQALEVVNQQNEKIQMLQVCCQQVMNQGGRIILVGCGASGRVAVQIEHDWRSTSAHPDAVLAVLAGGDVALIESVEACEDSPQAAVAQLNAIGLTAQDLLIALSAGGESPFILGALEYAQNLTQAKPWFIYCNPDSVLLARNPVHIVGRSGFSLLNLTVGPMALTGSTRMQATTAMTFALMQGLFPEKFRGAVWCDFYRQIDWSIFTGLTLWESECMQHNKKIVYEAPAALAVPILADLTERSPTFNLPSFVDQLVLADVSSGTELAWQALLLRAPRIFSSRLFDFDLSYVVLQKLQQQHPDLQVLKIIEKANPHRLFLYFSREKIVLDVVDLNQLEVEFLLRLILVNHSTLVMGRLGYYHGNLMTNLKPSNAKLIDRTIRYVLTLHERESKRPLTYAEVALKLQEILPLLQAHESIVFRLLAEFKS
jgi:N-acetylmuramic acid 6-phosphate etherase